MMIFFQKALFKTFLSAFFILVFQQQLSAQEKCGTVLYNQIIQLEKPNLETESEFEEFIKSKSEERRLRSFQSLTSSETLPLVIPVVVHVIHKGEPVGTGANLSKARILSQIQTLNEDFRRKNADTVFTPSQFRSVAADTEIEFKLATVDPDGFTTNGIVRVQGSKPEWSINEDGLLKGESYWPAEDYLNIWVTDLASDILGYAQFPESDLAGLEFSSKNRLTDGVVIDYEYFGNNPQNNSIGRTATHEIGHFLGLRHIWGDGGCRMDDYCDDTPNASRANYTCTSERGSCGSRDMVENYMDYTNDSCMNLFTLCQKTRMRIVLDNSPRRSSLKTSPGLGEPALVEDDIGIDSIVKPLASICEETFTPEILIKNHGTNTVNTVEIGLFLNDAFVESLTFSVSLKPLESEAVSFTTLSFTEAGSQDIRFEVFETNKKPDKNPANNIISGTFHIRTEGILPLVVDFDEIPEDWLVLNPDSRITWQAINIPETGATAAMIDFYNYDRSQGELDYLLTPSFDMRELVYARLSFRIAYAQQPGVEGDELTVAVSKDCGNTFHNEDILYRANGSQLATAPSTEYPFSPTSRMDWRLLEFDLSGFIGEPNIQIAFIGQNGHGNRLYLGDVLIEVKRKQDLDLNLLAITSPSNVSCHTTPVPVVDIKNEGRQTINTFTVFSTINNSPLPDFQYSGNPVNPGEQVAVSLPGLNLSEGEYQWNVEITEINGQPDDFPDDNEKTLYFVVDDARDIMPHKETFENMISFGESLWSVANPDNDVTWDLIQVNNDFSANAAFIRNFVYDAPGQEDWLVSPVFDLGNVSEASMFFSVAHASNSNHPDGLEIKVSTDCGVTFPETIFRAVGEDLSTTDSDGEFFPASSQDFRREFVDLTRYAGENEVRIAFVATTGYGNNLFLDDIEFFISADPEPVPAPVSDFILYPNPASNILNVTFNLAERENLSLSLIDNLGRAIFKQEFPNTLNQTYEFDLTGIASGIYLMRFQGASFKNTRRVVVNK